MLNELWIAMHLVPIVRKYAETTTACAARAGDFTCSAQKHFVQMDFQMCITQ